LKGKEKEKEKNESLIVGCKSSN